MLNTICVQCEKCHGTGHIECPACRKDLLNEQELTGVSEFSVCADTVVVEREAELNSGKVSSGELDLAQSGHSERMGPFGRGFSSGNAGAEAVARVEAAFGGPVKPCSVCSGTGWVVCPGCLGGGYIDVPAFA